VAYKKQTFVSHGSGGQQIQDQGTNILDAWSIHITLWTAGYVLTVTHIVEEGKGSF
jgi:hypothetical protein